MKLCEPVGYKTAPDVPKWAESLRKGRKCCAETAGTKEESFVENHCDSGN
ncbi:hypothetical protein T4B_14747 [Trichinella pseudospiralis]|uniref:Uncharacterized protein n=1 Tax=Trichinella pseudospiralis TaxID=6337 RepID=A0A0V1GRJ7_TRIPS|nr:hypothetical protein T4B_14747 [Trichinella pseudospiralis]KRZ25610.1 hypothetical protein T4C_13715 [Trichinella pseudospiralis]